MHDDTAWQQQGNWLCAHSHHGECQVILGHCPQAEDALHFYHVAFSLVQKCGSSKLISIDTRLFLRLKHTHVHAD